MIINFASLGTGGGGSNNYVSSTDVRDIVKISENDYDSMSAHSQTTLYVIPE